MKLLIRKAEINDSSSIATLSNKLGYTSGTIEIQKRLIQLLKSSDNCVLVAIENEAKNI